MLILLVITLATVAVILRFLPHYIAPKGLGVDHWFWKAYIEEYRRNRIFPPVLPQYIFDQHQWYPPFFPLLMAKLSPGLFDRWGHIIAIIIDIVRMLLLLLIIHYECGGSLASIAIAGIIYATAPIQIFYNIQLNPRGLGALFLDSVLIMLLFIYNYHAPFWVWIFVLFLSGLILLTHKMTTQLFWFIALCCSIIYRDWLFLLLIPGSMAAAMILSKGFYWKVLLAHWDIISFWNRNWHWIGADPIRESQIYGNGKYERPNKLHLKGFKGLFKHAFWLFGFNPSAWIACLLIYERLYMDSPLLLYPSYIIVWLILICIFALLTTYVSSLKCLGAGYLYVYNTSLLSSLLIGITFCYSKIPAFTIYFSLLAIVLNIAGVLIFYRKLMTDKEMRVDQKFDAILQELSKLPRGVVMCLPAKWYDITAYKTGHPVLYGAHGYGFKLIEPTFPRFLLPVREIINRYNVKYLLTMKEFLPANFMADLPASIIIEEGEYEFYCFNLKDN